MRKLLLFLIPLFFISVTYSQDMQVGAMGGLNLSFASASEAGMVFHGSPGVRFSLGGYMDVALPYKGLSFHPCILFSRESYTVNYEGKNPVVMSYINVPLTMLYHLESMQNKLFFGLGTILPMALEENILRVAKQQRLRGETTRLLTMQSL